MNMLLRDIPTAALLMAALLTTTTAIAQDKKSREGMTYVGLLATALNHRSVGQNTLETTMSSTGSMVLGTHISDHFHVEIRAGAGTTTGEIDNELELDIEYFASWYIGGHYPVTDYANAYAQFGFSHIEGVATLTPLGKAREADPDDRSPYASLANEYPDSSFSVSWLLGLDFEVVENGFIVLEGGRLFEDTETGANTFQFSTGFKYEF
ncbi:outer membrane beta-barrel protein [Marinobacter sp. SS13-12]|uniref:outer membrane beta-barrel protein n=1 Tax=Marinobacter sp. SS13-12 TaxID=3050451 RepID=UPI002554CB39|nr:outer membrane beta-barrel protein [Marinobacter sp. SS13-12]MDK8465184.1 outer membrane beta-barrel protein [Marinobacter sp. SS13-12]